MNVIYKVVEGKPLELPKTYSKELNDLGLAVNIFDTEDEDNNVISNPVTLIAEISKPY